MRPDADLVFDPVAPYRSAQDVTAAARYRDWRRFSWILTQVDPHERVALLVAAAEAGGRPMAVERLAADPTDSTAAALLGQSMIVDAWEVRTGARAEYVSEEQFAVFHRGLQEADLVLTEALLHHPDDAALWAFSLSSAMGLGLGSSEAAHRFQQADRLLPGLRYAQAGYLQYLCPKWRGSWPEADAFAESCLRRSAPGGFGPVAVAQVAIEHVAEVRSVRAPRDWLRVLAGTPWPERIRQAADRSILHPQFQPRYGWAGVLHTFAAAFCLAGDPGAARMILARCGPYATELPWTYFGDPATMITLARAGKPVLGRR